MLARTFVYHEPLCGDEAALATGTSSSLDTTLNRTGLSSLTGFKSSASSTSRAATQSATGRRGSGNGIPLEGGGSTAVVPWDELASSIIPDPKEKAAALIMLHRSPLQGTAVPCNIIIHNDKVLEITLATHRTGVFPLNPTTETFLGETLDRQQRRRVVIPISTISSIGCDLPRPTDGEGSSAATSSWTDTAGGVFDSVGTSDDASAPFRYGYEIAGSPMRALRITLHIQHDPTQRASEWFGPVRSHTQSSPSHRLRPRTVVFYATSLTDANVWRAHLRKLCQGNLTDALGRATWKKLGDAGDATWSGNQAAVDATQQQRNESALDTVLNKTRGAGNQQSSDDSWQAQELAASVGSDALLLDSSPTPTADFLRWHARRHLTYLAKASGDVDSIEPSQQRMMVRLKDCTGYGVWCPYGHKWLSEVQPSIRLEALERVHAATMPIMEEVDEGTVIPDVAPWIVLQRNSSSALHENILHSQSMRRDLMWRLSSLRHRIISQSDKSDANPAITASSELSWLDARARFLSPANFQRLTAQKYIDVEGALGEVIDSIADRLSTATGIDF
jgi:hypothetical protein